MKIVILIGLIFAINALKLSGKDQSEILVQNNDQDLGKGKPVQSVGEHDQNLNIDTKGTKGGKIININDHDVRKNFLN